MTLEFWKQMAEHYIDEGSDVMSDLFNESYGFAYYAERIGWENIESVEDGNYLKDSIIEYNERVKGTPADINLLYKNIISAIREIDENRVIILQLMNPVYKENGELRTAYLHHQFSVASLMQSGMHRELTNGCLM